MSSRRKLKITKRMNRRRPKKNSGKVIVTEKLENLDTLSSN